MQARATMSLLQAKLLHLNNDCYVGCDCDTKPAYTLLDS